MKQLIDEFVFVRLVKANNLDLTLFQFDFDLTFSVFFMNPDMTIYGRYGTRSSLDNAEKEMSLDGLAKSMSAALEMHNRYPCNAAALKGKQPLETKYRSSDDFPSLRGKFENTLDYEGAVTQSCMHCHQIRDAARQVYRDSSLPIPDRLLFPNPEPQVIGLTLDPNEMATVSKVEPDSIASKSGFENGDQIIDLAGQPILSIADVQWVLHGTNDSAELAAIVQRGNDRLDLTLILEQGWRRHSDISWRVSSWPLRRMGTGGLKLSEATREQRQRAKRKPNEMSLVVEHVGQYGPHAVAKRAGFKKSDVLVSFDGQTDLMTPSLLLAYAAQKTNPGQRVPVTVMRKGRELTLKILMQK